MQLFNALTKHLIRQAVLVIGSCLALHSCNWMGCLLSSSLADIKCCYITVSSVNNAIANLSNVHGFFGVQFTQTVQL